jgi:hypothetical protein
VTTPLLSSRLKSSAAGTDGVGDAGMGASTGWERARDITQVGPTSKSRSGDLVHFRDTNTSPEHLLSRF